MQALTLPDNEVGVMCLLAAQLHVDFAEFEAQWCAHRAGLDDTGITRYAQLRVRKDLQYMGGSPELPMAVDGIEEFWLRSHDEFVKFSTAQNLARLFCPLPISALTIIRFAEIPVANALDPARSTDDMVKRLVMLVRKRDMSQYDFMGHWVNVHQDLARAAATHHSRYHQIHVLTHVANPPELPDHGVRIDGISESWFRDEDTMYSVARTPAGAALAADNRVYVEASRKVFFYEYELLRRTPDSGFHR